MTEAVYTRYKKKRDQTKRYAPQVWPNIYTEGYGGRQQLPLSKSMLAVWLGCSDSTKRNYEMPAVQPGWAYSSIKEEKREHY